MKINIRASIVARHVYALMFIQNTQSMAPFWSEADVSVTEVAELLATLPSVCWSDALIIRQMENTLVQLVTEMLHYVLILEHMRLYSAIQTLLA